MSEVAQIILAWLGGFALIIFAANFQRNPKK